MNKTELLEQIVGTIPRTFFREFFDRVTKVVGEARTSVREDTRLDEQEHRHIEGQLRYAMSFKQLRHAANAAGLEWEDYQTDRGNFQYPVVTGGAFMFTVSVTATVEDLPEPSDYRTSLAQVFNAAYSSPKLRDRDRLPLPKKPIYGILTYTVMKGSGTVGWMGLMFPNDEYSACILKVSSSELMGAYDRFVHAKPATIDDKVVPRVRVVDKEGNKE